MTVLSEKCFRLGLALAAAAALCPLSTPAIAQTEAPSNEVEAVPLPEPRPDDLQTAPQTEGGDAAAGEASSEEVSAGDKVAALPQVDGAVLQGLDKITARISTFVAPIGETVRFGSLDIVARTCHKTPPEEPPERTAFLEVVDAKPDSPPVELFRGWMFASSPAISALEHPVYDVWVVDCMKASSSASETSSGN